MAAPEEEVYFLPHQVRTPCGRNALVIHLPGRQLPGYMNLVMANQAMNTNAPNPVVGIFIKSTDRTSFLLNWTLPDAGGTFYDGIIVYVNDKPDFNDPATEVYNLSSSTTSITISSFNGALLIPGAPYYVWIVSADNTLIPILESEQSSITVTTVAIPSPPTGVSWTSKTTTTYTLGWTLPATSTSYDAIYIRWNTNPNIGMPGEESDVIPVGTAYTVTSFGGLPLVVGTRYYSWISTRDTTGVGAPFDSGGADFYDTL